MKQKLSAFFRGRYGADTLARGMLVAYLVLAILTIFVQNGIVRAILNVAALTVSLLMFFRMFSGNIAKRTEENQKYLRLRRRVKQWFLLRRNKWKYRKTHVYRRCPHCGIDVRLPRRSGTHICDCPKCGGAFDVKIK